MKTNRILLRERTPALLSDIASAPKEKQLLFFGLTDEHALQRELDRIKKGQYSHYLSGTYFDLLLNDTNEVIGSAGFHTWWRDHDRAEIGYWLNAEKHRRQGYMNEVLPVLLEYGFKKMHLNRVEAHTAKENIASIALLEKYGFKREATIHGHYKMPDGSYADDYLFYLLKEKNIS